MKKIIFVFIALLAITSLSVTMTSCLEYDEPGDEFELGQLKLDTAGSSAKPNAQHDWFKK